MCNDTCNVKGVDFLIAQFGAKSRYIAAYNDVFIAPNSRFQWSKCATLCNRFYFYMTVEMVKMVDYAFSLVKTREK